MTPWTLAIYVGMRFDTSKSSVVVLFAIYEKRAAAKKLGDRGYLLSGQIKLGEDQWLSLVLSVTFTSIMCMSLFD